MYSNIRSYFRINDKVTQPFNCNMGTMQGDVSSTIIFSLFINDLYIFFKTEGSQGYLFITDSIPDII